MTITEHYASDVLFFFDGKPMELSLYQTLFERMEAVFPAASVKVQKSQISFYTENFAIGILTFFPKSAMITLACGGIAQLGERLNGIQEVSGSIPLISTKKS